MSLVIGVDEAGYAPNLGPLVISASVWEIDAAIEDDRLYDAAAEAVCCKSADAHAGRVAWADSKALYSPAEGLRVLERGVLAALALAGHWPADWRALWRSLDPPSHEGLDAIPWHVGFNRPLPLAADRADLDGLAPALAERLAAAGIRLLAIHSRALFPEQCNSLAEQHGNKAEMLSRASLELVAEILSSRQPAVTIPLTPGPSPAKGRGEKCRGARIICDRHGGRARYGRLLQQQFPEYLVEVRREDPTESAYAWGAEDERIEMRFRIGGEAFLPVAVASMASKYLREAAMLALNDFWLARLPELRPTAGYPLDARRFKEQIEPLQRKLGVADRVLWRDR